MAHCGLDGKPLSIRTERFRFRVDMVILFAGQLPKELDKLVNLTHFDAQYNSLSGVLNIRTEHFTIFCGCVLTYVLGAQA